MDREAVREVFLLRREDCPESLEEDPVEGGMKCPYCGSLKIWAYDYTRKGVLKYECQKCERYLNDPTGTIFEHHHPRLRRD